MACRSAVLLLLAGCASQDYGARSQRGSSGPDAPPEPVASASASASAGIGFATRPDGRTGPLVAPPLRRAPGAVAPASTWGEGPARSFLVPAGDILGFQILLNQVDRQLEDGNDYDSDYDSIRLNLQTGWAIDRDPFAVNQVLHPYQGAMYHGFARSAGLNYWESLGYDFVGSAIWEVAGETVPPSLNDQITTTFGGSFLGEALFRMANAVLGSSDGRPGFGHELGAAVISPSTGFNRFAFGDRFDGVYPSNDAPIFWRAGLGLRHNERVTDLGVLAKLQDDQVVADLVVDYGLPGKPGYEYERPFDYFHFELTATSSETALPENVMVAGLLLGSDYHAGPLRGIWGLYGTYDYITPDVFSVSSTALQFGTTSQLKFSDTVAVQGTGMAGVGWAAAGTIADAETDRSYHYGVCPQSQVGLRLIGGSRAMLDVTGRAFYLDGTGSNDRNGHELILRARVAMVLRVYGHHGLTLQYIASSREANYDDPVLSDTLQEVGSVSILYTFLGDSQFGIVD